MKNLKVILVLIIAVTTVLACSKDDDETTPSNKELLVENSPWKFNGVEVTNVVNTGTEAFDVDIFETKIRETNANVFYSFSADGTGQIIDNNNANDIKWEILENNQFKIATKDGENEIVFSNLKVTNTKLEFSVENMTLSYKVKANVTYLLSNMLF